MTKRRWLPRILAAGACTLCLVAALVWWQERGLEVVEQRLGDGDAAGALAAVEGYLQRHPTDERALALRARALVRSGYPAEAVRLFDQVGAAEMDDLRDWSTALLSLGQWDRALPILGRMSEVEPADGEILERITICQFELGHRQAALDAGRRLAELPGFQAHGNLQLASMYTEWGSSLNAVRYFKKVLEFRPDATGLPLAPVELLDSYADALMAAGNARQAVEILERRSALQPSLETTLRSGEAWQLIGDAARARDCFERVLRQQADHRTAHLRLAEIALQQGDAAGAIDVIEPLVAQEQVNAEGAYLLWRAYTALGDETQVDTWQAKTATLRLQQRHLRRLLAEAADRPATPRAMTIAAYAAAADQDWKTAGQLLASLLRQMPEAYEVPFVQQLVDAVRSRDPLPPITSLPPHP